MAPAEPPPLPPPAADSRATGPTRAGGKAGFLLVETLATFTISAFVLLGLVTAASVLLRAVDFSVAHIERVDDLGRAMEAIRQDIAGITRARWNGNEPQAFVFRGGPNSLYFAQAVPATDGHRVNIAVALREIVVDGRPVLARTTARLGARATSFGDLRFGPQHEIWTGAARLLFAYVPRSDDGSEAPPRKSWPTGVKLPAAILVEAVDRETRRVLVATRVTIDANADVGCLEDEPPPTAPTSVTQSDPSRQGDGGAGTVPSPDLPKPDANGTPVATDLTGASAPAFCSLTTDAKDAKSPKAPAPGPQL